MRRWVTVILLLGLSLGLAPALHAGGVSCTTQYDKDFQVYRTRCTDGRQFKSQYDRDFQRYRTRELSPWQPLQPPRR
jgi:hypothetical protein